MFEGKDDPFLAACRDDQVVSSSVGTMQVGAAAPRTQQIRSLAVHHTGAVGQFEIHTDRAVAVDLQTFSGEVLVHPVLLGHWDILGLDHLVVHYNLAYFQ